MLTKGFRSMFRDIMNEIWEKMPMKWVNPTVILLEKTNKNVLRPTTMVSWEKLWKGKYATHCLIEQREKGKWTQTRKGESH